MMIVDGVLKSHFEWKNGVVLGGGFMNEMLESHKLVVCSREHASTEATQTERERETERKERNGTQFWK